MNYYETLIQEISKSMKLHPKSAMAMDMKNFKVIAKGKSLEALGEKISGRMLGTHTIVFQKPNQKAAWIL